MLKNSKITVTYYYLSHKFTQNFPNTNFTAWRLRFRNSVPGVVGLQRGSLPHGQAALADGSLRRNSWRSSHRRGLLEHRAALREREQSPDGRKVLPKVRQVPQGLFKC